MQCHVQACVACYLNVIECLLAVISLTHDHVRCDFLASIYNNIITIHPLHDSAWGL